MGPPMPVPERPGSACCPVRTWRQAPSSRRRRPIDAVSRPSIDPELQMREQRDENNDGDWYADQPEQDGTHGETPCVNVWNCDRPNIWTRPDLRPHLHMCDVGRCVNRERRDDAVSLSPANRRRQTRAEGANQERQENPEQGVRHRLASDISSLLRPRHDIDRKSTRLNS